MKKPKKKKARNPYVVAATKRKAGKMKRKKDKRKKNKELKLLKEETNSDE